MSKEDFDDFKQECAIREFIRNKGSNDKFDFKYISSTGGVRSHFKLFVHPISLDSAPKKTDNTEQRTLHDCIGRLDDKLERAGELASEDQEPEDISISSLALSALSIKGDTKKWALRCLRLEQTKELERW